MPNPRNTPGSVTIFDVAEDAGVSTATVSRVANGLPNIRGETRRRVEAAMERLGYVANLHARGLAGGKTSVIGLLVHSLESTYINQIVRGIDSAVSKRGYDLMLSTMHLRSRNPRYIDQLFNGLVDGLIVLLAFGFEPYMAEVAERGFPIVLIDHEPTSTAPVIKAANTTGTRAAIQHLVELGHRRIGFITGELDVASASERLDAYRSELERSGIAVDDSLVRQGNFLVESGARAASELLALDDPPTAIMASSDTEALGVMQVARARGLSIPRDLSLVGFDDIPEATFVTPSLTTVRQPLLDMGRLAAETLMDTVADPTRIPTVVELPTELIIRQSSGPAPS